MSLVEMITADGKKRLVDVVATERPFHSIQSILLSKAEPFKLCLAGISRERMEETVDLENMSSETILILLTDIRYVLLEFYLLATSAEIPRLYLFFGLMTYIL